MQIKKILPGILLSLASLVLVIGSLTFFDACESEGEMIMACHWARNAVVTAGIVLLAQSVLSVFIPDDKIKTGLYLGVFLLSIGVIFIPGTAIDLCMMDTMRCHSVFRPAVTIVSIILTVISGLFSVLGILKRSK